MTIYWGDGTSTASNPSGGSIQQVQTAVYTGTTSYSIGESDPNKGWPWFDVGALSVNITPSSTSNKILVSVYMCGDTSSSGSAIRMRINRSGTGIQNSNDSWRPGAMAMTTNGHEHKVLSIMNYVDSPSSTSQRNYKVQICVPGPPTTWYLNRTNNYTNSLAHARTYSWITVMETT
ncbi:hypothetical protein CMK18_22555 [Candidatus Poribacteria bacterium]|nr:hypothetical protein [Candidatus Poribacteria bacterium]|tara:strand:- start:445 stop:972 length:528 start_codon:yes stop_codon:yes gene_type:complete